VTSLSGADSDRNSRAAVAGKPPDAPSRVHCRQGNAEARPPGDGERAGLPPQSLRVGRHSGRRMIPAMPSAAARQHLPHGLVADRIAGGTHRIADREQRAALVAHGAHPLDCSLLGWLGHQRRFATAFPFNQAIAERSRSAEMATLPAHMSTGVHLADAVAADITAKVEQPQANTASLQLLDGMLTILAAVAQFERVRIGERIKGQKRDGSDACDVCTPFRR
jgi:hypothetical protein